MKRPKKPQSVSIAPGAVAAPEAIGQLLQYREDSLTAQLGGSMARAMKGAGPSGNYARNWVSTVTYTVTKPPIQLGLLGALREPLHSSYMHNALCSPQHEVMQQPVAYRRSTCSVPYAVISCSRSAQSAFPWQKACMSRRVLQVKKLPLVVTQNRLGKRVKSQAGGRFELRLDPAIKLMGEIDLLEHHFSLPRDPASVVQQQALLACFLIYNDI